jgi:hypothetical protein
LINDDSGFDLNRIDPIEVGKQISDVFNEFGSDAATAFIDKLAATLGIIVINEDRDRGRSSEYIHTRIKGFIMYCGLLYEISKINEDEDED